MSSFAPLQEIILTYSHSLHAYLTSIEFLDEVRLWSTACLLTAVIVGLIHLIPSSYGNWINNIELAPLFARIPGFRHVSYVIERFCSDKFKYRREGDVEALKWAPRGMYVCGAARRRVGEDREDDDGAEDGEEEEEDEEEEEEDREEEEDGEGLGDLEEKAVIVDNL